MPITAYVYGSLLALQHEWIELTHSYAPQKVPAQFIARASERRAVRGGAHGTRGERRATLIAAAPHFGPRRRLGPPWTLFMHAHEESTQRFLLLHAGR